MDDEFLSYYHQELAFIRQQGKAFAKAYPRVAGQLKLGSGMVEDPHVARLIESFAFLTARIQQRLEDDLPELNDTLLDIIYPHYRLPIPAMSIVQFSGQPDLQKPYEIPRYTLLETEAIQGNYCNFRTGYASTILPIDVIAAQLYSQPLPGPSIVMSKPAVACLKITLCCTTADLTFKELAPQQLRFYLNLEIPYVYNLYELLFNHAITIALVNPNKNQIVAVLPQNNLRAVGFSEDEALLPYTAPSFVGYRLLSEFFAFAEKFLFFDLLIEQGHWQNVADNQLEIYIYFNKIAEANVARQIDKQSFRLNCTPIINLFPHTVEPIRVNYTQPEYPIIMDARKPDLYELHSIQQVTAISDNGELTVYQPFYKVKYDQESQKPFYWHLYRRPKITNIITEKLAIAFSDAELMPLKNNALGELTIHIEALATNGNLSNLLPVGEGRPHLQFVKGVSAIKQINCLCAFSLPQRPSLRQSKRWQVLSHLALNHLSLANNQQGVIALKEILQLYNHKNTEDTQAMITGIVNITSRRIAVRNRLGLLDTLYQGTELTITVDESCYPGASLFLFANVLRYFFSMYCTINSFVELVIRSQQKRGDLYRWMPQAGCKVHL